MCDRIGVTAEDSQSLVPDLVAVAVGAVQQVAAPPLPHALDVGQLVPQPGGDEHAASGERLRPLQLDVEALQPAPDPRDTTVQQGSAVALYLRAPSSQQLLRGEAVARQE